jgi:hypothetical protein
MKLEIKVLKFCPKIEHKITARGLLEGTQITLSKITKEKALSLKEFERVRDNQWGSSSQNMIFAILSRLHIFSPLAVQ